MPLVLFNSNHKTHKITNLSVQHQGIQWENVRTATHWFCYLSTHMCHTTPTTKFSANVYPTFTCALI